MDRARRPLSKSAATASATFLLESEPLWRADPAYQRCRTLSKVSVSDATATTIRP